MRSASCFPRPLPTSRRRVLEAGCTPVIDATGEAVPEVRPGAWVRTRPGRPAPGTGPVILAELGAPIPDRDTWLETSVPRDVPSGFRGLVLKGREAGGLCGEEDGLVALARCADPSRVILDAGVGPRTAAAAAALGAAACSWSSRTSGARSSGCRRASSAGCTWRTTRSPGSSRACGSARARPRRSCASWSRARTIRGRCQAASGAWATRRTSLWLVGQGLALARGLVDRYGTLPSAAPGLSGRLDAAGRARGPSAR